MLFPTLTFHIFFLLVFGVNWALRRSVDWRLIFLLVASWIFYGVGRFFARVGGARIRMVGIKVQVSGVAESWNWAEIITSKEMAAFVGLMEVGR